MPQLSTILLVDDDSTTNFLNQSLIKRANLTSQVFVAENGHEALQLLRSTYQPGGVMHQTLILLDMNMPVMNGLEFLEAYAQLPAAQQRAVVVVMLTTSLLPRDLERAQRLPIAGVLTKPLTKEKLHLLIEQHFAVSDATIS